ncbi:MAG: hypothetical protein HYV27_04765 [Candidatus Hydrogenedentes bacterium]|nr:hypothetical protein [Candidatus Hydrogenedentota bacterium]
MGPHPDSARQRMTAPLRPFGWWRKSLNLPCWPSFTLAVWVVAILCQAQTAQREGLLLPNPGASIEAIHAVNGRILVDAVDPIFGREWWAFDPAVNETSLVRDLLPGRTGGHTMDSIVMGNHVYFIALESARSTSLWRTDGTPAGTEWVASICPNPVIDIIVPHFATAHGLILFVADDQQHGTELWRSDGSTEGTWMLKDLHAGNSLTGTTSPPAPFRDYFLFRATPAAGPGELWRTDGSRENTYPIVVDGMDLKAFQGGMAALGDRAIFTAGTPEQGLEPWYTDGTAEGTRLLRDILPGPGSSDLTNLFVFQGMCYFQAKDDEHGAELWRTDGTPEGTGLFKDIDPGGEGGTPAPFVQSGDRFYFVARDAVHGNELWCSDGTPEGTRIAVDVYPGTMSSNPYQITAAEGGVFFSANEPAHGEELWFTDGSAAGTRLVKDINPGPALSEPYYLCYAGGILYFEADDGRHGSELWRSDGAEAGTQLVADIALPPAPLPASEPGMLTAGEGHVCFIARDRDANWCLYRTNGQAGNRTLHTVLPGQARKQDVLQMLHAGGRLFVILRTGELAAALWVLEEASGRFETVGEMALPPGAATDRLIAQAGETVYFPRQDAASGTELWALNGTTGTPALVLDLKSGVESAFPGELCAAGSGVYFTADDGTHGMELWRLGQGAPELVLDIAPGRDSSSPSDLCMLGDTLYFIADDGVHGVELWSSGGTAATTRLVADINPVQDARAVAPAHLSPLDGRLFFAAHDGVHGAELWMAQGDTPTAALVRDLYPGPASSFPDGFIAFAGQVYFSAESRDDGIELWVSDGTSDGTHTTTDLTTGPASSHPRHLTVFGSRLYFSAASGNPVEEAELWSTDGTTFDGYHNIANEPGSFPEELTVLGDVLLITADDRDFGREIWRIFKDPTMPGTQRELLISPPPNATVRIPFVPAQLPAR